jgi:hypothetical protein
MIELTERRLTGKDGTCKTDDRLREGVALYGPYTMDKLGCAISNLNGLRMSIRTVCFERIRHARDMLGCS